MWCMWPQGRVTEGMVAVWRGKCLPVVIAGQAARESPEWRVLGAGGEVTDRVQRVGLIESGLHLNMVGPVALGGRRASLSRIPEDPVC